jgi:SNF2 family DNA or RNA helicase
MSKLNNENKNSTWLAIETFKTWCLWLLEKNLKNSDLFETSVIKSMVSLSRTCKDLSRYIKYMRRGKSNLKELLKWMSLNTYTWNLNETRLKNSPFKLKFNKVAKTIDRYNTQTGRFQPYDNLYGIRELTNLKEDMVKYNMEKLQKSVFSNSIIRYNYKFHLSVNKERFSDLILKGLFSKKNSRRLTNDYFRLRHAVCNEIKRNLKQKTNIPELVKELDTPVDYDMSKVANFPTPTGIQGLQLFSYQKLNLLWLMYLESSIFPYKFSICEKIGKAFICPFRTECFRKQSFYELSLRGGCLLDEVGLGKTIVIISLVVSNPAKETEYPYTKDKYVFEQDKKTCPAVMSSGKNKGKKCGKVVKDTIDTIYTLCGAHRGKGKNQKDPGFKRPAPEKVHHKTTPNFFKMIDNVYYLKSRATLIIAPNQLPYQWREQIQKYTNPKLKVCFINTLIDWRKLTYRDLVNTDFVITTLDFLTSKNDQLLRFPRELEKACEGKESLLAGKLPKLYMIYWYRIVIDEIHKLGDPKYKKCVPNIIYKLKSEYKHGLSSSAFEKDHHSFNLIMRYLGNMKESESYIFNYMPQDYIQKHFRKNNKESTRKENLRLPKIKDTTFWLKLNGVEKAMYDARIRSYGNVRQDAMRRRAKEDSYLRQLCCYPLLSSQVKNVVGHRDGDLNLSDITRQMIRHISKELRKTSTDIYAQTIRLFHYKQFLDADQKKVLEEYENEIDNNGDPVDYLKEYRSAKRRIKVNFRKVASLYASLDEYQKIARENYILRQRDLLKIPKYNNGKFGMAFCCLCQNIINGTNIFLISCGHYCCSACSKRADGCSACGMFKEKKFVRSRDIMKMGEIKKAAELKNAEGSNSRSNSGSESSYEEEREEDVVHNYIKNKDEYSLLTFKNGTKLTNLILYLRDLFKREPESQVIIFSQWDQMLSSINKTLKNAKLESVVCKGNIYTKNLAVQKFKFDSKHRILLMSHKYSAAGLDLTEANKILFFDPVYHKGGTSSYKDSVELQAIGRAHRLGQKRDVEVVRFIIKDSVEEMIYEDTKRIFNKEIKEKELCELVSENVVIE